MKEGYNSRELRQLSDHPDLPEEIKLVLLTQQIVLLNRYYRYYFATHDNRFRLTVDTDLSYYRVTHFGNCFIHSQTDTATSLWSLNMGRTKMWKPIMFLVFSLFE